MKIALIRPPATYADWYKRPPLGIGYLGSFLESQGYQCRIFDAYFHSWSQKQLLAQIREYQPQVVGISAMTHEIIPAARLAADVKAQQKVPVVVGGCHVTALPQRTLDEFPAFDFGIFGEGEHSFWDLLRCLEGEYGSKLSEIRGLVFRDEQGRICVNDSRPFLSSEELDKLPYPAYHQYFPADGRALAGPGTYYAVMSGRGCPYHCAFCMQVLGRKVRLRSATNILAEIKHAQEAYGAHTVNFIDEIFLLDNTRTRELLEAMIERGLPQSLQWHGTVRANLVKPELIALARKAGCRGLGMGVESGDDGILKAIGKEITVSQIREAVKTIKREGLTVGTYYILGHPGETRQTMRKTIDLAVELNTETIAVGLMVPYPGTQIFEMALRGENGYRLLTQDWSQYDKYYTQALEIKNLPYAEMRRAQKWALISLYVKNGRILDAIKYFWERKGIVRYLIRKLAARLTKRAAQTELACPSTSP